MIVIPEYFPRLAFFSRLSGGRIEDFDLAPPYMRQTYQNRTKIRTPSGWQWLTVPVKKLPKGSPLGEMEIDYSSKWVQDHLKGLRYNYETAPFYEHYIPSITKLLVERHEKLSDLTIKTVNWGIESLKLKPLSQTIDTVSTEVHPIVQEPAYRQNFPGFEPGLSVLDALFNLGPMAQDIFSHAT